MGELGSETLERLKEYVSFRAAHKVGQPSLVYMAACTPGIRSYAPFPKCLSYFSVCRIYFTFARHRRPEVGGAPMTRRMERESRRARFASFAGGMLCAGG